MKLNSKQLRSCPTGFNEEELSSMSTIEIISLRKTTLEYLKTKSLKSRNKEFVFLLKRISEELTKRNYFKKSLNLQKNLVGEYTHKINKTDPVCPQKYHISDISSTSGSSLSANDIDKTGQSPVNKNLISTKFFSIYSQDIYNEITNIYKKGNAIDIKSLSFPQFLNDFEHEEMLLKKRRSHEDSLFEEIFSHKKEMCQSIDFLDDKRFYGEEVCDKFLADESRSLSETFSLNDDERTNKKIICNDKYENKDVFHFEKFFKV